MNHSLPLFIDITSEGRPLICGISDPRAAPGPTLYSGSPRTVSLCLVTPPTTRGGTGTVETTTRTITLTAKRTRADEGSLFTPVTLTATGSGDATRYEGVLDTTVAAGTFAEADTFGIILEVELKDSTTTPIQRLPYQFGATLIRKVEGDTTGTPAPTSITEADADARYLSYIEAQALTDPNKLRAWQNLGGTTYTLGLISPANQAAHLTAIGLGSAATPAFTALTLGPASTDAFYAQGELPGIVTATVIGAAENSIFTMDATGLTVGMYVHGGEFPSGTTILAIGGTAPTHTVEFSQDKLTSGTSTIFCSTSTTPFPRLRLNYNGATVFLVDHTGAATFAGNVQISGSVTVAGNITATDVTATTLYSSTLRLPTFGGWTLLDENGDPLAVISDDGELFISAIDVQSANAVTTSTSTLYVGTYQLTLGGAIAFTATGRALAQAADATAAFSAIKQAATATTTGVVREWLRAGTVQLTGLTQVNSGAASTTTATPVGYELPSGTTSTTGFGGRRSAPSNSAALFEGKSAGVLPWASQTIEGEVLLLFVTGWEANAVFRLHLGRTNAQSTGNTAHATHPQSFEIRYEKDLPLKVICATATDGATTTVTSSFTPVLGIAFRLRWKCAAGTLLVWVNGTLVATNTGAPTADSSPTANVFYMGVENISTVSASSTAKTSIPVLDIY